MYLLLNNHEVGVYYLPIKSGWIFHIAVLLGFRGWHIQKSLKCLDLTIFSPGSVRWRGRRRRGGGSRHQRGESGEEFFSGKGVGCFNLINRLTVFVYTIYISTSSIIPIENAYVWVYIDHFMITVQASFQGKECLNLNTSGISNRSINLIHLSYTNHIQVLINLSNMDKKL